MSIRSCRHDRITAFIFIAPFFVFFAVFKLYPVVYEIGISLLNRNSIQNIDSMTIAGLKNFLNLVQSESVWISLGHTVVFSLVYVLSTMVFSLASAMLLNTQFKGRPAVRSMFYMPYVTNLIAVGIVWKYLLNPYDGPINSLIRLLVGTDDLLPQWLTGTVSALPTTALITTWVTLAFSIITYLAALQDIPKSMYEVASIEGATPFQEFRCITLNTLKPITGFLLIINTINSFRNFTVIVALTNGGPGDATKVSSFRIYEDAFRYYKFSYASAHAIFLTVVILLITLAIMRLRKRWN